MASKPIAKRQRHDDLATPSQIATALADLGDGDLVRLQRIAKLRTLGLKAVDWRDVLNEAVLRVLSGSRKWPRKVPFMVFMSQTIRSITNEHWRQIRQGVVTLEADLSKDPDAQIDDIAPNSVSPEREALARNTLSYIVGLFEDDRAVLGIIEGLGNGLSPAEIQETSGMNATEYATAQRRIRRRLARAFFEEK